MLKPTTPLEETQGHPVVVTDPNSGPTQTPHRFFNRGDKPARILSVSTEP
jgi:hypothetical protein